VGKKLAHMSEDNRFYKNVRSIILRKCPSSAKSWNSTRKRWSNCRV